MAWFGRLGAGLVLVLFAAFAQGGRHHAHASARGLPLLTDTVPLSRQMADYIEHSYRANPQDGASLIVQGREYVVDSVCTSVTYMAHLHDSLETIVQGQEVGIDRMAARLDAVSFRAAAVKDGDGLAYLKEQLGTVPTWSVRMAGVDGAGAKMFSEIPMDQVPCHVRTTQQALQTGAGGGVAGSWTDAQREGLCYNLSSLDDVGACMASEEDQLQDAAARQARQVRRPTIEAAGMLIVSLYSEYFVQVFRVFRSDYSVSLGSTEEGAVRGIAEQSGKSPDCSLLCRP